MPFTGFHRTPWEKADAGQTPTFRSNTKIPVAANWFPHGDPRNDHEGLVPTPRNVTTITTPAVTNIAISGLNLPLTATPRTDSQGT